MSDIFNPLKFWHHLFLFHLVLLIFLGFVNLILFELLLDLIDFFMEKSTNIALLLDKNFWGFWLNWRYVGNDFSMKLLDVLHSISVTVVKSTFWPSLKNKLLDFILQFFNNFSVLNLSFYKPLFDDGNFVLKLLTFIFLCHQLGS